MSESLTLKYRPADWKDVVGQDAIVRSIQKVIATRSNRTFLFSGPSGTGKTTVARIAASKVGCAAVDEINAAKLTGVEEMRALTDTLQYKPLDGKPRVIILDECHRLTGNAFDSLLKALEEPPEFLWFFLCTTNTAKVPQNIQTRCTRYSFSLVPKKQLTDLLYDLVDAEKIKLGKNEDDHADIIDICVKEAGGSPRMAIVNLSACAGAASFDEAAELLKAATAASEAIELARALMARPSWFEIQGILSGLAKESPENVRHVVRAYMTNVLMNPKLKGKPDKYLEILQEFSRPFASTDGISPLVLACGRILYGVDE